MRAERERGYRVLEEVWGAPDLPGKAFTEKVILQVKAKGCVNVVERDGRVF